MKNLILLFSLLIPGFAHSQITVVLQQPSPFRFDVDNLWKVTLTNPGASENKCWNKQVINYKVQKFIEGKTTLLI